MNNNVKLRYVCAGFLVAFGLAGCASLTETPIKPSYWTSELNLTLFLKNKVELSNQKELKHMLDDPWYTTFNVVYRDGETTSMSRCNELLSHFQKPVSTIPESDFVELNTFKQLCTATSILANATSFNQSYIPQQPLYQHLPQELPADFGFSLNGFDHEHSIQNPDRTWHDVNPDLKFTSISQNRAVYEDQAGSQTLMILGGGDFNHDAVEDLLIGIEETVKGGSFHNFRVIAVTRDTKGWRILQDIQN